MTLCYPVLYFSAVADMSKKQDRIDAARVRYPSERNTKALFTRFSFSFAGTI